MKDHATEISDRIVHIKTNSAMVAHDVANAISILDAWKIARENGDTGFDAHAHTRIRELLCKSLGIGEAKEQATIQ